MPGLTAAETLPLSVPAISPSAAAIILAAGRSTRMRSKLPKMLHPLCGQPMTAHVIRACQQAGVEKIVVVVGHEADAVKAGLGDSVEYALQAQQRGTGDAVQAAKELLGDWSGTILVLAGDVPLLSGTTLAALLAHHAASGAAATLLTAYLEDPTGYGRVVRDNNNHVARIVEHKDANEAERGIKEWNPSLYAFESAALWSALSDVRPSNVQGEYYLTDTIGLLAARNARIEALAIGDTMGDTQDVFGVNTRVELAACASIMRHRLLNALMLAGVSITDPANTYVDVDVAVGQDTVIEPNSYLLRGAKIGEDCVIGPLARIENSQIGDRVRILASQVVDSVLEDDVKVGPFANLRPGTHLGKKVKIGDFVEVKNSHLHEGAQASHLAYIGDAEVGEGANIGGGVITCNYDGYHKHRTIIGKRVFVGSNSTLVAPVTLGDGAFVAAASAITMDVPADALGIARSYPSVKEGWAARYHARQQQTSRQQASQQQTSQQDAMAQTSQNAAGSLPDLST